MCELCVSNNVLMNEMEFYSIMEQKETSWIEYSVWPLIIRRLQLFHGVYIFITQWTFYFQIMTLIYKKKKVRFHVHLKDDLPGSLVLTC